MASSDSMVDCTEVRHSISPYDITAADNPGAVISYPLLKGANYDKWAVSIKTALCSQKNYGFLDGSIVKPESESPRATANAVNASVVASLPMITNTDRDGVIGLTNKQWEQVCRLLNARTLPTTKQLIGMYSSTWILDTGASHHMTGHFDKLSSVRNIEPILVILADGTERLATQEGTIHLSSQLVLKSVFHVEGLKSELISVGQLLDENNCVVQLANKFLVIQDRITKMVTGVERRENGTFFYRGMEMVAAAATYKKDTYDLWHQRFGHPSDRVLNSIFGVSVSTSNKPCDACQKAKQTRNSFPVSFNNAEHPFDLIHCDIWGPYREVSFSRARYFLTIVDDNTRSVWIYLLKSKSDTQAWLRELFALVSTQFNTKVKKVRSDNGSEFLSLTQYFADNGIVHETSCGYTLLNHVKKK